MRTRMLLALTVPAVALVFSACSSGSTGLADDNANTTLDDTLNAAVSSAADATAGDVDVLGSAEATLGNSSTASSALLDAVFSYGAANCTLNASSGRFDCASVASNGLTLLRSFAFLSATGQLLPVFNDTATASVDMTASESGVRTVADGSDNISRTRDLTLVGGLHSGTTRTWNGTGTRTDSRVRTDSAVTRTANTSDASTFSNVVIQLPRSANPWPMSGTVTRLVTGTGTVTRNGKTKDLPISKTVIVTFNGTSTVPMTVGGVAFTLDLSSGKATKN